ncbi:MAG: hypothetical protein PVJ52_03345 [Candidatus Woesebacteria bacterium]|jgi:sugar-specific transcriptional regulator TrmB
MPKSKYKVYFEKMIDENQKLFDEFKEIHNEYGLNQDGLQDEFNQKGKKILSVIQEYENRLCSNTERGKYNKFSARLAEKFQNEVRKHFPLIDHVGIRVEEFSIKKINLV